MRCNWLPLGSTSIFLFSSSLLPASARVLRDISGVNRTYDYVIAGGGLTGLVVANRLTEDANITVLVVEYGDFDDSWELAIPYNAMALHGELLFTINSVRQPGLSNRAFGLPLGATVGGGSTVNGMSVTRGSRHDYDDWERLGNPGWGWGGLAPYFRKSSTLTQPSAAARAQFNYTASGKTYGDGPFQAGFPTWVWPAAYNYIRAWTQDIGLPFREDGATDGGTVGVSWKPINIDPKNVTRSSARKAYYDPAGLRRNLDILVTHYVATVETAEKAVIGVHIAATNAVDTNTTFVGAGRETILAAGTVHTPQILQLSGIGPAALLRGLNISVVEDLPGVGANLQDHPRNAGMVFQFLNDTALNPSILEDPEFKARARDEYMANRTGPWTSSHNINRAILSLRNLTSASDPAAHPRILAMISSQASAADFHLPASYASSPELRAGYAAQHALLARLYASEGDDGGVFEFTWGGTARPLLVCEKPFSRGTVSVRSTRPHPARNAPALDFGSMANPVDLAVAAAGVRMARRLMAAPSMAELRPVEVVPGVGVQGDLELEKELRGNLLGPHNAHPVGTAAMMPRALGGVVDSELRVYGIKGLRIVDASVLPMLPAAHLQAGMYAVAEKAADIIKGKA